MPEMVLIEFAAPEAIELYHAVNEILDVDPAVDRGDLPGPLLSHVAGASGDRLVVVEVWASRADQERFLASRLAPAFEKAGVPKPARVEWLELAGSMHR